MRYRLFAITIALCLGLLLYFFTRAADRSTVGSVRHPSAQHASTPVKEPAATIPATAHFLVTGSPTPTPPKADLPAADSELDSDPPSDESDTPAVSTEPDPVHPGKLWKDTCHRCAVDGCEAQGEACLDDNDCKGAADAFAACLHPEPPGTGKTLVECLPLLETAGSKSRALGECVTQTCASECF